MQVAIASLWHLWFSCLTLKYFRCNFDGGDCCKPDWYKDDYCDQRNNNEVSRL